MNFDLQVIMLLPPMTFLVNPSRECQRAIPLPHESHLEVFLRPRVYRRGVAAFLE